MEGTVVLSTLEQAALNDTSDEDLVLRILGGETLLFELIMRRHSQRLYRVARGILRDRCEAEDVMQAAYVRAYQHLSQFAGRAKFSTWLTRIAVHEALNRLEERARLRYIEEMSGPESPASDVVHSQDPTPEQAVSSREHAEVLEKAVLALPPKYRVVVMMRDLEEMSVAETAGCLDITEENVKVRLHRARAMLRQAIFARIRGRGVKKSSFSPIPSRFAPQEASYCRPRVAGQRLAQ
jgi:RNA polymerase sigma-70 factor, ECF subfamily